MAKKTEKKLKQNSTKTKVKAPWVWLLTLVPLISAGLYILILSDTISFIKAEIFHFSGVLVLLCAIVGWGACGYAFGYSNKNITKATLIAHSIPIVCALVYTVTLFSTGLEATELSTKALVASLGMGLFSYIDTFIYKVFAIGVFGLYIDLIFMVFTFVIGFAIGKSKKLKA